MSGRRELEDDKVVVTELGRLVHIAKANEKQRRVIDRVSRQQRKAAKKAAAESGSATRVVDKGTKRGKKRRSVHGGSIVLTFSPAFAAGVRQMDPNVKQSAADMRSKLSKKRCEVAIGAAEAYISSAISQAVEAGLATDDGKPVSEEGAQYLSEQFAVAKSMLRPAPVGSRLAQLLEAQQAVPPPKSVVDWAMDHVTKERLLLRCPAYVERDEEGNTVASVAVIEPPQLTAEEDSAELAALYSFQVGEQALPGSEDIVPSKCIVKLKGPSKKVTTIIRTQKSASAFKLNLLNLLKKEAASLLAKDPVAAAAPSTNTGSSPKKDDASKKTSSASKKTKK